MLLLLVDSVAPYIPERFCRRRIVALVGPCFLSSVISRQQGFLFHYGCKIQALLAVRVNYRVALLRERPIPDRRRVHFHLPEPSPIPDCKLRPTIHPVPKD